MQPKEKCPKCGESLVPEICKIRKPDPKNPSKEICVSFQVCNKCGEDITGGQV